MLGFYNAVGRSLPVTLRNCELQIVEQFYGAHAYLLTQQGARILLEHDRMDILTCRAAVRSAHGTAGGRVLHQLQQLGMLRMFCLRESFVERPDPGRFHSIGCRAGVSMHEPHSTTGWLAHPRDQHKTCPSGIHEPPPRRTVSVGR